ncbi:MAG: hypothetical protein AB1609_20100 [Bacillota bacterium]
MTEPVVFRLRRPGRARLVLAVAAAGLALAVLAGRWALSEYGLAARSRASLASVRSQAASAGAATARAEAALAAFREASEPLAVDVGTGWVLARLEELSREAGVLLVAVQPEEPVDGFFRGHLRAVPYRVEARGPGPGAQCFLALLEGMAGAAEVRVLSVAAPEQPGSAPGDVSCSCLLLLYSLNPPQRQDLLPAPAPRDDVWTPLAGPEAPEEREVPGVGSGG